MGGLLFKIDALDPLMFLGVPLLLGIPAYLPAVVAAKDVAAAIRTVRDSKSAQPAVRLAFEFLVLAVARSGEVWPAT